MSEYQSYRWSCVGRTLSSKDREKVNALSSHISVGSASAHVEYHYGDFKHDAVDVLKRHFDVFTYEANWGSQIVAFRFPKSTLNKTGIAPYLHKDIVTTDETKNDLVFAAYFCDENYVEQYWDPYDDDNDRDEIVPLYSDILGGDYRCPFLLWLKACDHYGVDGKDSEVPIPDGLSQLDASHRTLIELVGIPQDLITAAASLNSKTRSAQKSPINLASLINSLPPKRANHYLLRLLKENNVTIRQDLIVELESYLPKQPKKRKLIAATFEQIQKKAAVVAEEKKRLNEKKVREEQKIYLHLLVAHEPKLWDLTESLIAAKNTKAYVQAIDYLHGLELLSIENKRRDEFATRVTGIANRFPRLTGMRRRLEEAGFLDPSLGKTISWSDHKKIDLSQL